MMTELVIVSLEKSARSFLDWTFYKLLWEKVIKISPY